MSDERKTISIVCWRPWYPQGPNLPEAVRLALLKRAKHDLPWTLTKQDLDYLEGIYAMTPHNEKHLVEMLISKLKEAGNIELFWDYI